MPPEKVLKNDRLTKTRQYSLVYKKGIIYRSQNLKLWVMPSGLSSSRAGFLVTKKNAATIVRINRIKRLLKEVHRLNKKKLKGGFDLIIGCQGIVDKKTTLSQIENILLGLFKKAGILC